MNTLNVMTIARNRWFHLGVVALVSILLSWAVVLHLVTSIQIHVPEVGRETSSAPSAGRLRFEDFKQAQAEGRGGARVSAPSAGRQRFEDFKQAQAEGRGGARVSAPSAGRLRFEDFKRRQIEQ